MRESLYAILNLKQSARLSRRITHEISLQVGVITLLTFVGVSISQDEL